MTWLEDLKSISANSESHQVLPENTILISWFTMKPITTFVTLL